MKKEDAIAYGIILLGVPLVFLVIHLASGPTNRLPADAAAAPATPPTTGNDQVKGAPSPVPPPVRKWTSNEGKTLLTGAYVSREEDLVLLAAPDGSKSKIPSWKLSAEDQTFLRDQTGLATHSTPLGVLWSVEKATERESEVAAKFLNQTGGSFLRVTLRFQGDVAADFSTWRLRAPDGGMGLLGATIGSGPMGGILTGADKVTMSSSSPTTVTLIFSAPKGSPRMVLESPGNRAEPSWWTRGLSLPALLTAP